VRKNKSKNTKKFYNSEIPADWEIKSLSELGEFSKGQGIRKDQIQNYGFPCITYGEIYTTHNFVIKEFKSFIPVNLIETSKLIKKGDILFAGSGETLNDIGKAVVYMGEEEAFAGGDIIILRTESNKFINPVFVSYMLESDFAKRQRYIYGQGISVVHIYKSELSKIKIPIPPLPEQNTIAKILGLFDKLIELYSKLLEQKQLRKKWLISQLLSDKKKVKNIKSNWSEVYLSSVVKIPIKEPVGNPSKFKLISVKLHSKGLDYQDSKTILFSPKGRPYYIRYKDEILIGRQNIQNGGIAIVNEEFNGSICSNAITSLIVNESKFNKNFILYYLINPSFYKKVERKMNGTGQKEISEIELLKIKIYIPESIEEQELISKVIDKCEKSLILTKQILTNYGNHKMALMQQLLAGKIRIKNFIN